MATQYLTPQEMLAYFPGPQLAQALGSAKVQDTSAVDKTQFILVPYQNFWYAVSIAQLEMFIQMAEQEADAYISTHYQLPLTSVPDVLKQMVADVARYVAYAQKQEEIVKVRYDRAIAFLSKIAKGQLLLGVPGQDKTVAPLNNLPTFKRRPSRYRGEQDYLAGNQFGGPFMPGGSDGWF